MNTYQRALAKKISEQYWWRGEPGMLVVYGDLTFRLRDPVTRHAKHIIQLPKSWGPVIMMAYEIMPDITDLETLEKLILLVREANPPLKKIPRGVVSRKVEAHSFEGFDRSYMEYQWISPGPWYREKASAILAAATWKP